MQVRIRYAHAHRQICACTWAMWEPHGRGARIQSMCIHIEKMCIYVADVISTSTNMCMHISPMWVHRSTDVHAHVGKISMHAGTWKIYRYGCTYFAEKEHVSHALAHIEQRVLPLFYIEIPAKPSHHPCAGTSSTCIHTCYVRTHITNNAIVCDGASGRRCHDERVQQDVSPPAHALLSVASSGRPYQLWTISHWRGSTSADAPIGPEPARPHLDHPLVGRQSAHAALKQLNLHRARSVEHRKGRGRAVAPGTGAIGTAHPTQEWKLNTPSPGGGPKVNFGRADPERIGGPPDQIERSDAASRGSRSALVAQTCRLKTQGGRDSLPK
jgi:hypothetical protein